MSRSVANTGQSFFSARGTRSMKRELQLSLARFLINPVNGTFAFSGGFSKYSRVYGALGFCLRMSHRLRVLCEYIINTIFTSTTRSIIDENNTRDILQIRKRVEKPSKYTVVNFNVRFHSSCAAEKISSENRGREVAMKNQAARKRENLFSRGTAAETGGTEWW